MKAPSSKNYLPHSVGLFTVMVTGSYGISVPASYGRWPHAACFLIAAGSVVYMTLRRWSIWSCIFTCIAVLTATVMRTVAILANDTANAGQRSYAISSSWFILLTSVILLWSAAKARVIQRELEKARAAHPSP